MIRLEWIFLIQIIMSVGMIILLQRLGQTKKQIDEISNEVIKYISYVTETVEEETKTDVFEKKDKDDAHNYLIQSVLGEYFP